MLASLNGHSAVRGRRGKIDLAALLWEVAPEARVQIEMGEGTTVFGDESELKRMLFVLLGQVPEMLAVFVCRAMFGHDLERARQTLAGLGLRHTPTAGMALA